MSVVPTSSVTSMFLYGLEVYSWVINGAVLGSDATATTYSLECGTQALATSDASSTQPTSTITRPQLTAQCSLPTSLHMTVGPGTMRYNAIGTLNHLITGITEPATTTVNCTWNVGTPTFTATPADAATTAELGQCWSIISVTDNGVGKGDSYWHGKVIYEPVTITGVVQAQATPTASASNATVTSTAGAPGAALNGMAGMGSLLAVVAVLMGFL